MLTIFKKEWKGYFHSCLGWLFMAVLLFFLGVYFTFYNMSGGSPYLAYSISGVLFFVLLLVPILTMRIWSEERRQKTDQLLFTSPIRTGKVLFGKFLAIEAILAMVVLIFGCYMFLPAIYGTVPYGENVLALAAFFLFGTACISIGFFLSVLTESQVIAAVLTYAVLMICAFMPSITGLFTAVGNRLTGVLNDVFDITIHLNTLMNGIIDLSAIIYYLSIIVLMLFLTWFVIQNRRKNLFRGLAGKCKSIGAIAAVLLVIVGIHVLLDQMPRTMTEYDITSEQMYSLTETTKEVLEQLDEDITIYVLADEADADQAIDMLLGRYQALNEHIHVSYKAPASYPQFASFYTTQELAENSLIIVGQERFKVIPYSDCYESAYQLDYTTYEYYEILTGFDGEGQITAGITYVVSDEIPVVYELSGHEEYELPDAFTNRVSKMNIEIRKMNLMQYDSVPEDAAAILVCGPILDYSEQDIDKIRAYLNQGGRGVFCVAFSTEDMEQYESLFSDYGLRVSDGVVFEQDEYYYKDYPYYLIPIILNTDLTKEFYENNRLLLLAQCRGLSIAEDYDSDHITLTPLLMTSDDAYSKVNVTTMETLEPEEGDVDGPFYLSVSVEKENDDTSVTKMVVIGTEFVADQEINDFTADANFEYILSCLSEIVETESTVSVPVKKYELSGILMNSGVVNVAACIMVIVIPGILLVLGVMIMVLRRRKHQVQSKES